MSTRGPFTGPPGVIRVQGMATYEAARFFDDLGTIDRAAGVLHRSGPAYQEPALELEAVLGELLDEALDQGLDYEMDMDEALAPEEELIDEARDALEDADVALEQLELVEQGEGAAEGGEVPVEGARRARPKKARRRKWLCCGEVELRRTRKGKKVWVASCAYRRTDGSIGLTLRVVGRNPGTKPRAIILDGKRLEFASDADLDRLLEEHEAQAATVVVHK